MKKILFSVLGISMFVAASNAQPFKQTGDENNLQLSFTPLGNAPISLSNGMLTYRRFNATGTAAWRVGFSIGSTNTTNILVQAGDTLSYADTTFQFFPPPGYNLVNGFNPEAKDVISSFTFSIRPGYEKHFAGTDRLSPYVGAELVFSTTTTKSKTDEISQSDYIAIYADSTTADINVQAPWKTYTKNGKGGSNTFGINLIAGFDYYFTKNLSLGAELNLGYYMTKLKDEESEYLNNTTTTTSVVDINGVEHFTILSSNAVVSKSDEMRGKSSGFGPGVLTAIKLGWLF